MLTFINYIENPMGVKNSVLTGKNMYRVLYTEKWDNIRFRENGKIKYYLYTDNNDMYYIHMKVPSEKAIGIYYDVVVQFYPDKERSNILSFDSTLDKYYVRFFSNDPHFIFTFAHAFMVKDLFIMDLKSKVNKLVVDKNPDTTNKENQIGYVKSIYFVYLEMKRLGLFNKRRFKSEAVKYKKNEFLKTVEHADNKISDRQSAKLFNKPKTKVSAKTKEIVAKHVKITPSIGNSGFNNKSSDIGKITPSIGNSGFNNNKSSNTGKIKATKKSKFLK